MKILLSAIMVLITLDTSLCVKDTYQEKGIFLDTFDSMEPVIPGDEEGFACYLFKNKDSYKKNYSIGIETFSDKSNLYLKINSKIQKFIKVRKIDEYSEVFKNDNYTVTLRIQKGTEIISKEEVEEFKLPNLHEGLLIIQDNSSNLRYSFNYIYFCSC